MARAGNNPKRRFVENGRYPTAQLNALSQTLVYAGSANHKRFPANYGFQPPSNPRGWKSMCDLHRQVLRQEAQALLNAGIAKGMISEIGVDGMPKYIWCVDAEGNVFEAKTGNGGYHGYQLEADDDMADLVSREWRRR
jgi:hypothetical protein